MSKDESARQKRGSKAPLLLALVLTQPLSFSLRLALAQNVYQLDQRCAPNARATNQIPRLFTFTSMGGVDAQYAEQMVMIISMLRVSG